MAIETIQIKRGNQASLPGTLNSGEPAWTLDTHRLYIGDGSNVPILVAAESSALIVEQAEIDFGATPIKAKSFTITDAAVAATSHIIVQLAYVAPTGKSLDELEFDSFDFRAAPGTGSFTLYARALEGSVADKFKINYMFNPA